MERPNIGVKPLLFLDTDGKPPPSLGEALEPGFDSGINGVCRLTREQGNPFCHRTYRPNSENAFVGGVAHLGF